MVGFDSVWSGIAGGCSISFVISIVQSSRTENDSSGRAFPPLLISLKTLLFSNTWGLCLIFVWSISCIQYCCHWFGDHPCNVLPSEVGVNMFSFMFRTVRRDMAPLVTIITCPSFQVTLIGINIHRCCGVRSYNFSWSGCCWSALDLSCGRACWCRSFLSLSDFYEMMVVAINLTACSFQALRLVGSHGWAWILSGMIVERPQE